MKLIIEGIDNLGKTTICQEIRKRNPRWWYHHNPKLSQEDAAIFYPQFIQLLNTDCDFLFDRGHIGEYVYSPLYRNYCGEYIFNLEKDIIKEDVRLVILKGNLDLVKDDGLSHDYTRRYEEQDRFLKGFEMSSLKDKRIVEVHKQNEFRNLVHIIEDILL